MEGRGKITFGRNVRIGVQTSPGFWTGYTYLECRRPDSEIRIGDETIINNGFSVIAETTSVIIGRDCLIGHDVYIIDSDFHPLDPQKRRGHTSETQRRKVQVGNNVFIGAYCAILKGTVIGHDCVVGAGSVVSGVFPENCLIAGNPARIIRQL
jgi:maltose O-acetyltransferase